MVHRNVKEALNLTGVQIKRNHPVRPRELQVVGNQLCRNWLPRAGLPVCPGVTVVRNNHVNRSRARPFQRINHNHEFHEVFINRVRDGLDDKHVIPPHTLVNVNLNLTVTKVLNRRITQRNVQFIRNLAGKWLVRIQGKQLHRCVLLHYLFSSEGSVRSYFVPIVSRNNRS